MSESQSFTEVGVRRFDEPLALTQAEEGIPGGSVCRGVIEAWRNRTLQEDLLRQDKNARVAYLP